MIQERKSHKVSQDGARDDAQEDPDVVGHDAEHQHVAQGDLDDVDCGLEAVQDPPPPLSSCTGVSSVVCVLSGS